MWERVASGGLGPLACKIGIIQAEITDWPWGTIPLRGHGEGSGPAERLSGRGQRVGGGQKVGGARGEAGQGRAWTREGRGQVGRPGPRAGGSELRTYIAEGGVSPTPRFPIPTLRCQEV